MPRKPWEAPSRLVGLDRLGSADAYQGMHRGDFLRTVQPETWIAPQPSTANPGDSSENSYFEVSTARAMGLPQPAAARA